MSLILTTLFTSLSITSTQPAELPDCIENPDALLQADLNNDGTITLAEVGERRAEIFARLDRNGDGVASMDDAPRRMGRDRFTQAFDQLSAGFDANNDGQLTSDEFVNGPTVGFDRVDANDDDILDAEELSGLQALACEA